MITRDLAGTRVVQAIQTQSFDASCESGSAVTGEIIDRLSLGRHYLAAMPFVNVKADMGSSTVGENFVGVEVALQHSTSTAAGDFAVFSTGEQPVQKALYIISNTSSTETRGSGFLSTAGASTSTGAAAGGVDPGWYDLTAAARYLRLSFTPEMYATSSGGVKITEIAAGIAFGQPDEEPHTTTATSTDQWLRTT